MLFKKLFSRYSLVFFVIVALLFLLWSLNNFVIEGAAVKKPPKPPPPPPPTPEPTQAPVLTKLVEDINYNITENVIQYLLNTTVPLPEKYNELKNDANNNDIIDVWVPLDYINGSLFVRRYYPLDYYGKELGVKRERETKRYKTSKIFKKYSLDNKLKFRKIDPNNKDKDYELEVHLLEWFYSVAFSRKDNVPIYIAGIGPKNALLDQYKFEKFSSFFTVYTSLYPVNNEFNANYRCIIFHYKNSDEKKLNLLKDFLNEYRSKIFIEMKLPEPKEV
jgi:hypothetical protein